MLIIFEGIDGSGKTTMCKKIQEYLKTLNKNSIVLREPGSTTNSEIIRDILNNKQNTITEMDRLNLFLLARHFLCNKIIKHIQKNDIVLLDRFIPSTIAYQHYGCGISIDTINKLHQKICPKACELYYNSCVIYLNIDVDTAFNRINKFRTEKEMYEDKEFLWKVSKGYDDYFYNESKKNSKFIHNIDTRNKTEEEVLNVIKEIIIDQLLMDGESDMNDVINEKSQKKKFNLIESFISLFRNTPLKFIWNRYQMRKLKKIRKQI